MAAVAVLLWLGGSSVFCRIPKVCRVLLRIPRVFGTGVEHRIALRPAARTKVALNPDAKKAFNVDDRLE